MLGRGSFVFRLGSFVFLAPNIRIIILIFRESLWDIFAYRPIRFIGALRILVVKLVYRATH